MPSSAVLSFSDADEYAASVRGVAVELTVTERGRFSGKLARIDLHRLWLQRFSENLPRVVGCTGLLPGRAYFLFCTRPGPRLFDQGREIPESALQRYGKADQYFQRTSGRSDFASMSLPVADIAALGESMAGADLTPPGDAMLVTPPPDALARLLRLHAAAGKLAEDAPEIIANSESARGLEQALIEAMAECLRHWPERDAGTARGQHAIVMRRFRRALEENPDQPVYIPEICKAIRVPERTLRVCCQEHLGMSPKRYLLLRRMNLARRALQGATPGATTVTDIATRYGFWQLGRFAVEYRALFGETPSAALRWAPG